MKFTDRIKERKFKYIFFFWIVISIQFVIGNNLQNRGYSINSFSTLIVSLLEIIMLSIIFTTIHYCVLEIIKKYIDNNNNNNNKKNNNKNNKNKKINEYKVEKSSKKRNIEKQENTTVEKNNKNKEKKVFIYFLIIIISWIPVLLAFNPCICNYDGSSQISTYMMDKLTTGNPIAHTYLLTRFYLFGLAINSPNIGMLLYAIFQMSIMALIFAYGVAFIEEKTNKKWLRNISIIFYAFFPFNQLFPLMTTKDTLFAGFGMMLVITVYKVLEEREKVKISDYWAAIMMTTLTILFRINVIYAMVAAIPFIIIVLFGDKENLKNLVGIIIISIILYEFIFNLLTYIMGAKKSDPTISKICMFAQATGKIVRENYYDLTDEEKEKINKYYTNYKILNIAYRENIVDYVAKWIVLDKIQENTKEYYAFTYSLFKKYPMEYIDSYLNTTRGYWYIQDDSFNKIKQSWKPGEFGCLELMTNPIATDEKGIYSDSKIPELKELYKRAFCYNDYTKIPILYVFFQPGIYFYMMLAFFLYSIYKKQKKCLCIEIIFGMYLGTLLLAPCAIIRYMYVIIVNVPILLGITINEKEEIEE